MEANQSLAVPSGGPSGGGVVVATGAHPTTRHARAHAIDRPNVEFVRAMSVFVHRVRLILGVNQQ